MTDETKGDGEAESIETHDSTGERGEKFATDSDRTPEEVNNEPTPGTLSCSTQNAKQQSLLQTLSSLFITIMGNTVVATARNNG